MRLLALALLALGVFAPSATAAPGDLDPSFSSDGRVTTLASPDTFVPRAVAVQGDGRIVVAGYSCDDGTCGPTGNSSFRLMRFTPDGGADTDFGAGGTVTTAVGAGRSQAYDLVLEADGGIVAAGVASASASDPGSFALARYRSNGALDESFGPGGRVITEVHSGFDAIADLVAQPDGRLAAAGQAEGPGGASRYAVARYNRLGRLDPTFGTAGVTVVGSGEPYAFAAAAALLPDGRTVALGASGASNQIESYRFGGVRLDGQGAPERAPWTLPVGSSYSFANAAAGLGDDRVLAAGVGTDAAGRPAMALVRTHAGDALDPGWDGDGVALAGSGDGAAAADVVLQPDGAAVAAGHVVLASSSTAFALARFQPSGNLDGGFGKNGMALTAFPPAGVARATAVARQGDGRLVVAGLACASGSGPQCSGGTARLALVRYLSEPDARVRVRCLQGRRCRGTLSLSRLRKGRTLLFGRRRASVRAHRSATVSVRLRRGLGASKRIRTRLSFRGRDAGGRLRSVSRRTLLRH